MAFTLEDGTGIAGANALISVQFFRDYHTDRGEPNVDVGSIADEAVEDLIVKATDYVVARFGTTFKGRRATETQTLPFPREGICIDGVEIADDAVPAQIQAAIAVYALVARDVAALMPNPPLPFDTTDSSGETISGGGAVIETEEQVGPIRERVRLESVRSALTRSNLNALVDGWVIPQYPSADLLIEPFLSSRDNKVTRA